MCTCEIMPQEGLAQEVQSYSGLQDPRPHVSCAWLLGDEEQAVADHIDKVRKAYLGNGMAWRDSLWLQQASLL